MMPANICHYKKITSFKFNCLKLNMPIEQECGNFLNNYLILFLKETIKVNGKNDSICLNGLYSMKLISKNQRIVNITVLIVSILLKIKKPLIYIEFFYRNILVKTTRIRGLFL
jgi:hypothetical protein